MTKIEAHVTTLTPKEIYSHPGTSSDPFPLTYVYNNDLGCYLTTSLGDQEKYKLLKDCIVAVSSFNCPFSFHSKKQKIVNCYLSQKHFDLFERLTYSKILSWVFWKYFVDDHLIFYPVPIKCSRTMRITYLLYSIKLKLISASIEILSPKYT
nr:unnamed protein product [Callosobruchus analis]